MIKTKQTFVGKMVFVDLCKRRKRHFIGINLQAMVDGNLQVITETVNQLHKPATAAAIRKNIVSCLAKLGILEKQICTLTTDNDFHV